MTAVASTLRRAIREETPARRDVLVATVSACTGTNRVAVREAVDECERQGVIYCVPDGDAVEVRETTREVA